MSSDPSLTLQKKKKKSQSDSLSVKQEIHHPWLLKNSDPFLYKFHQEIFLLN